MASWADVQRVLSALPGCEETTSYGTPSFKVKRAMLCRLREQEGALVVHVDMAEREALLQSDHLGYFTLPHYDGYPAVLVHLDRIADADLAELLELAWRINAPAKLVAAYDAP